ncbi:MAG: T9SS C-terminal target domain-containing protein, partial [Bacteroides sp.]|nr:T9SS C-terminal target domain-containing protein [Bacteroides sp.]
MKRVFTSSLAALCAIAGMAQTITVDDINYIVNEGTR